MSDKTCTHCLHYGHRASSCPVPRNTDCEMPTPDPAPQEPWYQGGLWPFTLDEADSA